MEKEKEYRETKRELRMLIKKAKSKAWQELTQTVDNDPWGLLYQIVMNRLRRNTPTLTEMIEKEVLENTLSELFPMAKKIKDELEDIE